MKARKVRLWLSMAACIVAVGVAVAVWNASTRAQEPAGERGALSFFVEQPGEQKDQVYAILRKADSIETRELYSDESGYIFFGDIEFDTYTVTIYAPPGTMPYLDEESSSGTTLISYRRCNQSPAESTALAASAEGAHTRSSDEGSPDLSLRSSILFRDIIIDNGGNFTGLVQLVPEVNITGRLTGGAGKVLVLERLTGSGHYVQIDHMLLAGNEEFTFCAVPSGRYHFRLDNSDAPLRVESVEPEGDEPTGEDGAFTVGDQSLCAELRLAG